jgi:hypothetical protein
MTDPRHVTSATIAALNDDFRKTLIGGRVMMTSGINALPGIAQTGILLNVRLFDKFSTDNDPNREHDFGSIDTDYGKVFWKIDYYNLTLDAGSEDPTDPKQTTRVLTIMLAEEY